MPLDRQLHAFRAAHPPASLRAAGHAWSYLRAGTDGPAVLVLTGALGRAEFGLAWPRRWRARCA